MNPARVSVFGVRQPDGDVFSDLALLVSVLQAQRVHGTDDGGQRLDGVAVNHGLVLLHVIAGKPVLVDDPGHTNTGVSRLAGILV